MEYFTNDRGVITGAKELLFTHGMGVVRVMDQHHVDWQVIYSGEGTVAEAIYADYKPEGGWVEKLRSHLKEPLDLSVDPTDVTGVFYRGDVEAGWDMVETHDLREAAADLLYVELSELLK